MAARMNLEHNKDVVSFIVIMDLVTSEDFKDSYDEFDRNPTRRNVTHNILYDDLLGQGTRIMIEGRELYSKVYSFDRHKECKFEDSFGGPIEEMDFSSMVEKDIWAYIYGVYLLEGRLYSELSGFGLIQL